MRGTGEAPRRPARMAHRLPCPIAPLYYGRPVRLEEPRRRLARKPAARGEISMNLDFSAHGAVCRVARVPAKVSRCMLSTFRSARRRMPD